MPTQDVPIPIVLDQGMDTDGDLKLKSKPELVENMLMQPKGTYKKRYGYKKMTNTTNGNETINKVVNMIDGFGSPIVDTGSGHYIYASDKDQWQKLTSTNSNALNNIEKSLQTILNNRTVQNGNNIYFIQKKEESDPENTPFTVMDESSGAIIYQGFLNRSYLPTYSKPINVVIENGFTTFIDMISGNIFYQRINNADFTITNAELINTPTPPSKIIAINGHSNIAVAYRVGNVLNVETFDNSMTQIDSTSFNCEDDDFAFIYDEDNNKYYLAFKIQGDTVDITLVELGTNLSVPSTGNVTGADGNLVILNGQTVNLQSTDIKHYNSVDIQAGGTLNIQGSTPGICQIGCANNFILNGQITTDGFEGNSQIINAISAFTGESLVHSIIQQQGGVGGVGASSPGGVGTNGYGGGGGGGDVFQSPTAQGGAGGSNNGAGYAGQGNGVPSSIGGAGNSTNANGANGGVVDGGAGGGSGGGGGGKTISFSGRGGGGGGHKGNHSHSIYIYCEGNLSGNGTINLNGKNGYNGGGAYSGGGSQFGGGGGGGGGAGGTAGKLILAVNTNSSSLTENLSGGTGGVGGTNNLDGGGINPMGTVGGVGESGQSTVATKSIIGAQKVSYPLGVTTGDYSLGLSIAYQNSIDLFFTDINNAIYITKFKDGSFDGFSVLCRGAGHTGDDEGANVQCFFHGDRNVDENNTYILVSLTSTDIPTGLPAPQDKTSQFYTVLIDRNGYPVSNIMPLEYIPSASWFKRDNDVLVSITNAKKLDSLLAQTFLFSLSERTNYFDCRLGQNLYFNSDILMTYNGHSIVENGFISPPAILNITGGTAGSETFFYVATYEYIDENGNIHRSGLSNEYRHEINANPSGGNQIDIEVRHLPITLKDEYLIRLFRTDANGEIYYLLEEQLVKHSSQIYSTTFNDTTATVEGNEFAYIQGVTKVGELENDPSPQFSFIITHNNRIFGVYDNDKPKIGYSKIQDERLPVQFNIPTLYTYAGSRSNFALASFRNSLIAFGDVRVVILGGDGLNNNGTNQTFTTPEIISHSIGCDEPNSVLGIDVGIIFKSNKGFYLINSNLQLQYIGGGVDAYDGEKIIKSYFQRNEFIAYFCTDNNRILCYHYASLDENGIGKWSVQSITNQTTEKLCGGISSANDLYIYKDNGEIFRKSDSFDDDGNFVTQTLTTGWIKVDQISGYIRVKKIFVVGDFKSNHNVGYELSYDYDDTVITTGIIEPVTTGVYEYQIHVPVQKCCAIKITIKDLFTDTNGESFSLTGMTLLIGVKKGLKKISVNKKN